jgi:molybdopterin biosynthesis enzyme
MSLANCLIDLPVGPSRVEKGELVDVILTEQPEPTR